MSLQQIRREMEGHGLELLSTQNAILPGKHVCVFRKQDLFIPTVAPQVAPPKQPLPGRIVLRNSYFVPVTIVVDGRRHNLVPQETRDLGERAAGPFTYEVLGIQGLFDRTLNPNEIITITVYPLGNDIKPGDTVVTLENTRLWLGQQVVAQMPRGSHLEAKNILGDWVGVVCAVGGRKQEGWVERRALQKVNGPSGNGGRPGHKLVPVSAPEGTAKDLEGRDIVDLVQEKIIEVQPHGNGIETMTVQVRRLVSYPVVVRIPVGTFFVSSNGSSQNMVTTSETMYTLRTDGWESLSLSVACANSAGTFPEPATVSLSSVCRIRRNSGD